MTITSVLCSKHWSLLFAPKILKHRYCWFLIQHSDSAELSQGLATLGHQLDQTKLDKLFAKWVPAEAQPAGRCDEAVWQQP
jgi:hypothetical protein